MHIMHILLHTTMPILADCFANFNLYHAHYQCCIVLYDYILHNMHIILHLILHVLACFFLIVCICFAYVFAIFFCISSV
jgi:hypothetical protein